MEQFLASETLIIGLLLIVSLVAIAVRRLRVPYTVALVIVGLLITSQQHVQIELTPELILALFVPPLVFEAAFHIDFEHLRHDLVPILVLAVPGVLLTMLIVGLVVAGGVGLSLTNALVFGALISATDPVAVVALFRAFGAPRRLTVIVEGESLFNDGTAIVVFNLILAAALLAARSTPAGDFNLLVAVGEFVRVSLGGIAIGIGLGWLISQLIARLDDYLIETTLTTVMAFGAYLVAERLHFSGVLHVLFWGGLRGAISLALALSLPAALPDRELLRIMAFGVVLFTLLAQGTTMQVLLRKLGLIERAPEEVLEYERRHGRLMAARAARNRLEQLHHSGAISSTSWQSLSEELDQHIQKYLDA